MDQVLSHAGSNLLDRCARLMWQGKNGDNLDLSWLKPNFATTQATILSYLDERILIHSDGQRTVSLANPGLFANHPSEPSLYLAVCIDPPTVPAGIITDLDIVSALYTLSPSKQGLRFAMPAPVLNTPKYREHRSTGETAAANLLTALHQEIKCLATQTVSLETRRHLEYCVRHDIELFTLEDAATAADIIDLSLNEFIRRIISR